METDTSVNGYLPSSGGAANIEIGTAWERPDAGLLATLRQYPVANIGDALGRLGMPDGGITALWEGCRAAGSALTVLTVAGDDLAVIDAVSHIQPGDFVVINAFGYSGRAVMGGILGRYFASRGAVGAIVDGAVRDRGELREQGFPVWSRTVVPAGPWKNGPGTIGTPVAIGGVVISPGDIVVADPDGIVAVPLAKAQDITAELARIAEHEERLHADAGRTIPKPG